MAHIVDMDGPVTLNPSDIGTRKKWSFRNSCSQPIFDFYIMTGPESFLEIEFPWGDTGNPPDLRRFTIREEGFEDGSKSFDDVTRGKATLDPPIDAGKVFEIELEFDVPFEPKEYVQIVPTDANGATIENDTRTETQEPNTGAAELLETIGKVAGSLSQLRVDPKEMEPSLRFDQKRGSVSVVFMGAARRPEMGIVHVKRKYQKRKADYGLQGGK